MNQQKKAQKKNKTRVKLYCHNYLFYNSLEKKIIKKKVYFPNVKKNN